MEIDKMSFVDMAKYLNEANTWFQSNGIKTENTRFATIKLYVEMLATEFVKHESGLPNNLFGLGNDIENSVYEAEAFVLIYRFLKHIEDKEFKRLCKIIVKGPDYSVKEDSNTNIHRNHLFELYLAAKLTEKGMTIKQFEDVVFDFEEYEIAIQCKRPFSTNSIGHLINDADRQFKDHNQINLKHNVRGIIAVSVDKILGLDKFLNDSDEFLIPKFQDLHTLEKFMQENLDRLYNEYRETWMHLYNGKILAIFFFFRFPIIIKAANNLLTNCGYTYINPLINRNHASFKKEFDIIVRLQKVLN